MSESISSVLSQIAVRSHVPRNEYTIAGLAGRRWTVVDLLCDNISKDFSIRSDADRS